MELLIDADILIFKYAVANQYTIHWSDTVSSEVVTDFGKVTSIFDKYIESLLKATGCEKYVMAISSDFNFRYKVLPTYKHTRANLKDPQLREPLKNYVRTCHPKKEVKWLEGDDVMGVMATLQPDRFIIASIDKDLDQIPGRHYNWNKKKEYVITQEEGDFFFYKQVLMGDSVDGYHGIPGIGPKKAEHFLNEHGVCWETVKMMYELHDMSEKDALAQARVAKILTKNEYDFKKKEVINWRP